MLATGAAMHRRACAIASVLHGGNESPPYPLALEAIGRGSQPQAGGCSNGAAGRRGGAHGEGEFGSPQGDEGGAQPAPAKHDGAGAPELKQAGAARLLPDRAGT